MLFQNGLDITVRNIPSPLIWSISPVERKWEGNIEVNTAEHSILSRRKHKNQSALMEQMFAQNRFENITLIALLGKGTWSFFEGRAANKAYPRVDTHTGGRRQPVAAKTALLHEWGTQMWWETEMTSGVAWPRWFEWSRARKCKQCWLPFFRR